LTLTHTFKEVFGIYSTSGMSDCQPFPASQAGLETALGIGRGRHEAIQAALSCACRQSPWFTPVASFNS